MLRPVAHRDHIRGPIHAPYALVEYGDYECARCGEACQIIKEVQGQMDGDLCFAFRNFPIAFAHPRAERAAEAGEAAAAQGFFWEMHDALFENQDALEDGDLVFRALRIGMDARRLAQELQNGSHTVRVREDFWSGVRIGIENLPALFVNGVRFEGTLDEDVLLAALLGRPYCDVGSLALGRNHSVGKDVLA
ncbi:MAG TPA: thioredoxin domain-containing protein [Verrucomicrobiae bacterium]